MDGYLITGIAIAGLISVAFFVLCILELLRLSDFPLFFAEWRGLGNGFGGWRLSRPFAFALIGFVFGAGILVTMVEKTRLDHAAAATRVQNEFELQKLKESEERKYRDADLARKAEVDKAKLTLESSAKLGNSTKKGATKPQ